MIVFFPCVFRIRIFLRFEKIFLFFTNNRVTYRSINRLWRLAESMGIKIHISLHFGMDNFVRFLLIPSTCSSFVRMLEGSVGIANRDGKFHRVGPRIPSKFPWHGRDRDESRGKDVSRGNVCSCVISPHMYCTQVCALSIEKKEKRKWEKSGTRDKRRRRLFSLVCTRITLAWVSLVFH